MVDIFKFMALDKTEKGKKPRSVHISSETNTELSETSNNTGFSQNLIVKLGCAAAVESKKQLQRQLYKQWKSRKQLTNNK